MHDDSEHVEQIFHIEEMKAELEELSDGKMVMGNLDEELPPRIEEQFLESVLAFERAEQVTHKELLARDGVALPAPDEMSDDELALKLIEIMHAMANRRTYLENTNHLSERELYTHLWRETLNEWTPDLPPESEMNCHIDILGGCSEEDIALYLKYYADDETRARWAEDSPDMEIPQHEDPPYDRDRHLPKPSPPPNPYDDPEVETAFFTACREKLRTKLENDGISHGAISDEPLSYAPDLACVWAVEHPDIPGTVGWWAISGDLPATYLSAADIPDPRAFLRVVSQHWRDATDAMERGNPPPELTIGPPKDWPRLIPMLRRRADTLEYWAGEDEAWEEENE